ncbi:MAG: hypothetical protein ACFFB3_06575 [Candidatus Hodarchaeota archaeon]
MTDINNFEKISVGNDAQKEVCEVYRLIRKFQAQRARQQWLDRYEEAWDAIENNMWTDAEKEELVKAGMVPLVTNRCNKGVQGSSAIVTDQKPELKFHPIGSGDLYVAELLKRAHDFIWTKNEGNDLTYHNVRAAKIGAIAFFIAKFDRNKGPFGRIINEDEDPTDVYWDADSRKGNLSDTPIIRAKLRTRDYILENYDGITDEDMRYEIMTKDEEGKSSGVEGEDNYAIEDSRDTIDDKPAIKPKEVWEIEAWIPKTVKEDRKVGNETLSLKIEKVYHRIIVGKKLVEENINPLGEDADGDPIWQIIPLMHDRIRKAYPMSPTNYAVSLNKEKNKRRAQFIYMVSQNANSPIVEPSGKTKWTGNPGTPGSRLMVEAGATFSPYRMPGGTLDATRFIELEKTGDQEIDDQYDMQDVMRGKMPPGKSDMSGRLILALQDMGGMMSKPFLRTLESALVRLAKVNIAMALKYWPRYMWERLIEPDEIDTWTPDKPGVEQEQEPNTDEIRRKWLNALEMVRPGDPNKEPNISIMDFDVKVMAGSSMPTNRIAKGQMAIEYVKAGIYDAEAALEYVDDPNKDKIIPRMKAKEETQARMIMLKGRK